MYVAGLIFTTFLTEAADNIGPGRGGRALQFVERIVAEPGSLRQGHADEERFFETDGQFFAVGFE